MNSAPVAISLDDASVERLYATHALRRQTVAEVGLLAPTIGNCTVFPPSNDWNRDITQAPIDARSSAYMAHMGAASLKLHADFGSNPMYGMPYVVVDGSQPRLPMQFLYATQSDAGPYPFPEDVPIQAGQDSTGDRHAIVIDKDNCVLYETWDTHWL